MFLVLGLLFLCSNGRAQIEDGWRVKDVPEKFSYAMKTNPKLLFSLDSRRSFVRSTNVKFWGVRLGFDWSAMIHMGIGMYGLSSSTGLDWVNNDGDSINDARLNFGYVSFWFEYVWFHNKRWQLSTPLHLGAGEVSLSSSNFPFLQPETKKSVIVTEFSVQAEYKIFWLVGLGAGAGYRYSLTSQEKLARFVNSPVYLFKVRIFLGEVYKRLFKKGEVDNSKP